MPLTMALLSAASWETITRRTLLMVQGTCSSAEYRRMVTEKTAAIQTAMSAMVRGKGQAAMVAPFVNRARANAHRLRRKT